MTTKKKAAAVEVHSEPLSPAKLQLQFFDQAIRAFGQGKFSEAKDGFEVATQGPAVHVKDKARSYLQVCLRKLDAPKLQLNSAEEYFTHGVERLNARDADAARQYLTKALQLSPNAEHIVYTLALACAQAGDIDAAYENLKRAIELEPRNRMLARQDQEFAATTQQIPAIRALLQNNANNPF